MEVLNFLQSIRNEVKGEMRQRVDTQITKIRLFLGFDSGFRKIVERGSEGRKGRKALKSLLEEVSIYLVNKPDLVSRNLEILKVVD